ncbi:MAG: PaaI family thioesterase, partial [Chloroflexota bacterium]
AMMDDVIGVTVLTLGKDHFYASVNLTVDFLAMAKRGQIVIVTAKVVRPGKPIINAECMVHNEKGRLIARGTSNLSRIGQRSSM